MTSATEHDDFDYDQERHRLIREVRQRLESLELAGVATLPKSPERPRVSRPVVVEASVSAVPAPPTLEPTLASTEAPPPPHSPNLEPKPVPVASPPPTPPRSRPTPSKPAPSLFGPVEFDTPVIDPAERPALLTALAAEVAGCRKCAGLAERRTNTVFADGSPTARLMFIGEAPGADEDRQGVPFVGRAGQLLTDMITKGMGLRREDVYIANILKCRPPENRDPAPAESAACLPYLHRQIEIVRPEYICLLGRIASTTLLETALSMSRLRGRWHRVMGVPAIATYHPAYLLRNPAAKKDAWEDLQMLMRAMGLLVSKKR